MLIFCCCASAGAASSAAAAAKATGLNTMIFSPSLGRRLRAVLGCRVAAGTPQRRWPHSSTSVRKWIQFPICLDLPPAMREPVGLEHQEQDDHHPDRHL